MINKFTISDSCVVEYFCGEKKSDKICVTFTERGNRTLGGLGFGGEFLRNQGFDIVAVKNIDDTCWYQNIDAMCVDFIKSITKQYSLACGYGSSMGGYAAIRFAAELELQNVFAISPLYDIRFDWDRRHESDANQIKSAMMHKCFISNNCNYFIAYDSKSQDARHFDEYYKIIDSSKIFAIRAPYAGHPVGPFLNAIGELVNIAVSILNGRGEPCWTSAGKKRRSKDYLYNISEYCMIIEKYDISLKINNILIDTHKADALWFIQRCKILMNLQRSDEAIPEGLRAIEMSPINHHMRAYVCLTMAKLGRVDEALQLIDQGIERGADSSALARVRDGVLAMRDQIVRSRA